MAKKSSNSANEAAQLDFLDLERSGWNLYVSSLNIKVARKSPLHSHPEGQLIWVLKGTLYLTTENKEWVVTPNRAIWVPPHLMHGAYSIKPIEIRTIYVKEKMAPIGEDKCLLMSPLLHELILYGAKFSYLHPPTSIQTAVCAILLYLMSEQEEEKSCLPRLKDQRLIRCREVLLHHLDQNLTLEEVAKKAFISKRTLSRLLHEELHVTFSDWKNTMKIFHSFSPLLEKKNVTEVAYELGFDSPNSFIRSFKKIKGITPKKYIALRSSVKIVPI